MKEHYKKILKGLEKPLKDVVEGLAEKKTLQDTEIWIQDNYSNWQKTWTSNDPNGAIASVIHNICSSVIAMVLLYRQGDFKGLVKNPSDIIKSFIVRTVFKKPPPTDQDSSLLDFEQGLQEILKAISTDVWSQIARPAYPDVAVMLWAALDKKQTEVSLQKVLSEIEDDSRKKEKETINSYFCAKTYEEYSNEIDRILQAHVGQPDLVLLDSVQLAEYKAKGVFDAVEIYITPKTLEKIQKGDRAIGKTVNGFLEAIPLTKNYHLSGFSMVHPIGNQNKLEWDIKKLCEREESDNFSDESYRTFPFSAARENENAILVRYLTMMGDNKLFTPMQAARGAHIAYTFFAYYANLSVVEGLHDPIFVQVDKKTSEVNLHVCSETLIKDRTIYFFKFIYKYVPVISLILDQIYSAKIRDYKNLKGLWFDPCLPIESGKFQEDEINFSECPAKLGPSSLSCLGGYCIALTSASDAKQQAAEIAVKIAENYYDKNPEDPCRIRYSASGGEKYKQIPVDIAKRPHFNGWKMVEEQISEIIRLYMATVMVLRSIIFEIDHALYVEGGKANPKQEDYRIALEIKRGIKRESLKAGSSYGKAAIQYLENCVDEASIKKYLECAKQTILDFWRHQPNLVKGIEDYNEWVDSNLNTLVVDRNSILGLIQSAIRSHESTSYTREEYNKKLLEYLSTQMAEVLVNKLKSLAFAAGWKTLVIER